MHTENLVADSEEKNYGIGSSSEFDEISDIALILLLLKQYFWRVFLFVVLVTLLAIYYTNVATPYYRAASTVLIEPQKVNVVSIEEFFGENSEHKDYHQTQIEILKSRKLAARVIDELQLWNHPEFSSHELKPIEVNGQGRSLSGSKPVPVRIRESATYLELLNLYFVAEQQVKKISAIGSSVFGRNTDTKGVVKNQIDNIANADSSLIDEKNRLAAIALFSSRLIIEPIRKTKLIKIIYESAAPELARDIANAVGVQYIKSYKDSKEATYKRTSSWLGLKVESLKSTLELSEQKLIEYKELNGLIDVGGSVGSLGEQELLTLSTELVRARGELANKANVLRAIRNANGNLNALNNIPTIQSNSIIKQIQVNQGATTRKLDELSNRYGELHPRIIDIKSELASLQSNLVKQVSRIAATIEKEHDLHKQMVATLAENLESRKQGIQALGAKKNNLEALEREVATNQKIYDTYFSRMSETNSATGLEAAIAEIVDEASLPVDPVRPKKSLILAVAVLASLLGSLTFAFLHHIFDQSVKGSRDVQNILHSRMLGLLPFVKKRFSYRKHENPIHPHYVNERGREFVEAMNTVKTAVTIQDKQQYQRVILITSSVPDEGKSTISVNLASAFGKLERVLIIDCDLRRPSLAKCFGGNKNTKGLSNLISNTASTEECLRREVLPGVDLIPSGPIPAEPLEYVTSARFKSILDELSDYYDRIIIDCAPTQSVSDALILSTKCDAVIYVVKAHKTSATLAKGGLSRLREVGAPIAGVILSQVKTERLSIQASEYYFQGYYDLYGYADQLTCMEQRKRCKNLNLTPAVIRTMNSGEPAKLGLSDLLGDEWQNQNRYSLDEDASKVIDQKFKNCKHIARSRRLKQRNDSRVP